MMRSAAPFRSRNQRGTTFSVRENTWVAAHQPLRLAWSASPAGAVGWRAQLYPRGDVDRLLLDARVTEPVVAWAEARLRSG